MGPWTARQAVGGGKSNLHLGFRALVRTSGRMAACRRISAHIRDLGRLQRLYEAPANEHIRYRSRLEPGLIAMQKVEGSNPISRSQEKPRSGGCRANPGRDPHSRPGRRRALTRPRARRWAMPQNFIECDRDQELLLPPSMREWLPDDHLAWFVADAVEEMDLQAFYGAYREDGWGRAAFEPQMMVALLLYAYAVGERSSRGIERKCVEDVAYRVIAAHQAPDHATIARFRVRHEEPLADLFTEVLLLCEEAGLVKVGLIAIDGTKLH